MSSFLPPLFLSGTRVVDFGLDWVRLSWVGDAARRAPCMDEVRNWYDRHVLESETVDAPRQKNLLGYVGRAYGAAWLGERDGDILFQVSGGSARHILLLPGVSFGKATRLDIQVTVWSAEEPTTLLQRCRQHALKARERKNGRPFRVRYEDTHGDGDTLYLGARTSDEMVRVYDKAAQSGGDRMYMQCTRFETEYKGDAAVQAWSMITTSRNPEGTAKALLVGSLDNRGLGDIEGILGEQPELMCLRRPETDAERKLLWLETQVAPTVKWLLTNGYDDATLYALGLEKYGVAHDVRARKD